MKEKILFVTFPYQRKMYFIHSAYFTRIQEESFQGVTNFLFLPPGFLVIYRSISVFCLSESTADSHREGIHFVIWCKCDKCWKETSMNKWIDQFLCQLCVCVLINSQLNAMFAHTPRINTNADKNLIGASNLNGRNWEGQTHMYVRRKLTLPHFQ